MLVFRRSVALSLLFCLQYCLTVKSEVDTKRAISVLDFMKRFENKSSFPLMIIFPTVIFPSKSNNNIQENFQNKYALAEIDINSTFEELFTKTPSEEDDLKFRQSLNRGSILSKRKTNEDAVPEASLQDMDSVNMNQTKNNTVEDTPNVYKNNTNNVIDNVIDTTLTNQSNTNNVEPTQNTTKPDDILPPVDDERWNNFTGSTNITDSNNGSQPMPPNEVTTEIPGSTNGGPYSNAVYNNGLIDQLSITTNSYTNEELPLTSLKDDRWRTFTSSKKAVFSATGFKPLAGLYYDGFLHKPLIMIPGFIPRKYYNLY